MSNTPSPLSVSMTDVSQPRETKRRRARHHKSRQGCYTCKLRRVKCDEARPVCGACSFRGESCCYPPPNQQLISSNSARSARLGSETVEQLLQPLELHLPELSENVSRDDESINMADMALLTYYMIHVSGNMAVHPERKLSWQRVIPALAAKHEYLMHLLLALAGTHAVFEAEKAHGSPLVPNTDGNISNQIDAALSRDYHRILEHHQRGLEGFRHALAGMTASNVEYVFCGSVLIVAFAFASLRIRALNDAHMAPRSEDSLEQPYTDWLHLVRGLATVAQEHWFSLKISSMRSLLLYAYANDDWKPNPPSSPATIFPRLQHASPQLLLFSQGAAQQISLLGNFASMLNEDVGTCMEGTGSPETRISPAMQASELLSEQIKTLEKLEEMYMRILYVFQFTTSQHDCSVSRDLQIDLEETAVLSWPHAISNAFILSLQPGQELGILEGFSYVILAHFYVISLLFEDLWYMKRAFPQEIRTVHRLIGRLAYGPLASLMEWPMAFVAGR
ncbi:hypothetical protein UA08_02372 [Talaromyces atroroseus]|uniref:Zn(2)-C6 fungal-type domain-containing protein n=1 Tax=Talaromyces atroroseus TaxID=1441469 RepID=A0A225ANW8_TALAT|nr:hypothetical protein UA08_02372 [Talaromyces atroroseus]OKL62590.1 hypothetical protein UA08_02372 [Talaromyces atroroseus]